MSVQSTAVITRHLYGELYGTSITVTVNPELTISGTLSATVGGSAPTIIDKWKYDGFGEFMEQY